MRGLASRESKSDDKQPTSAALAKARKSKGRVIKLVGGVSLIQKLARRKSAKSQKKKEGLSAEGKRLEKREGKGRMSRSESGGEQVYEPVEVIRPQSKIEPDDEHEYSKVTPDEMEYATYTPGSTPRPASEDTDAYMYYSPGLRKPGYKSERGSTSSTASSRKLSQVRPAKEARRRTSKDPGDGEVDDIDDGDYETLSMLTAERRIRERSDDYTFPQGVRDITYEVGKLKKTGSHDSDGLYESHYKSGEKDSSSEDNIYQTISAALRDAAYDAQQTIAAPQPTNDSLVHRKQTDKAKGAPAGKVSHTISLS